ncbi:HAD family phosphatase [Fulvivirga sp. RKSG066]|uniref:HAD family hydrolase n=1 Tax=Fulvivirga aurantia TaxID=2529383 RepID=UPI0012BCB63C|nr:HAD family phosphatase [Fulvivirga aurantia]MTI19818.1 HAD family phosphatase [Fulvivirga aurantia]
MAKTESQILNGYKGINALIFDLGGVIINLDISQTIKAFVELSGIDQEKLVRDYWHHEMFHKYERGEVSDEAFREFLRDLLKIEATDEQLDKAWNAMIFDIPQDRLRLLDRLSRNYEIFLLSNTNNIHLKRVNEVFEPLNGEVLDDYFTYAYYSNHMGMRKPNTDIFEKVIANHDLDPVRTLFLDDNKDNIQGAQAVGLQTFQVAHPDEIKTLFDE